MKNQLSVIEMFQISDAMPKIGSEISTKETSL